MTANAFREDKEKCLAAGMNAHLAKPIKIEIQEIEIGSPRVYINSPKFFKFGEEENNGK